MAGRSAGWRRPISAGRVLGISGKLWEHRADADKRTFQTVLAGAVCSNMQGEIADAMGGALTQDEHLPPLRYSMPTSHFLYLFYILDVITSPSTMSSYSLSCPLSSLLSPLFCLSSTSSYPLVTTSYLSTFSPIQFAILFHSSSPFLTRHSIWSLYFSVFSLPPYPQCFLPTTSHICDIRTRGRLRLFPAGTWRGRAAPDHRGLPVRRARDARGLRRLLIRGQPLRHGVARTRAFLIARRDGDGTQSPTEART